MLDIKSLEASELESRSPYIKLADWLTSSFGSILFLVGNLFLFSFWILVNTGGFPAIAIFDPYPFILLTMVVSLEAIILSIVVLMSQNRQTQVSTLRGELDMQVDLMAEREITKILYLLTLLLKKHKIKIRDAELTEMIKKTDVSYIESQIKDQIKQAASRRKRTNG